MASPTLPIVVGVAVTVVLVYVFRDKLGIKKSLVDKAQSMVQDTADAAVDVAESAADKATKAAKDVKNSVT